MTEPPRLTPERLMEIRADVASFDVTNDGAKQLLAEIDALRQERETWQTLTKTLDANEIEQFIALRETVRTQQAALHGLLSRPYGCPFCDSGTLRTPNNPAKGHTDDCSFAVAQKVLGLCQMPDAACEHGTALDVHCCNCHRGFIFDPEHECPPTREELEAHLAASVTLADQWESDAKYWQRKCEQTETDLAALRKERDELRLNFQEAVGGPLTPLAEDIDSAGMEANEFQREAVVSALRQLSALRQAHARLQVALARFRARPAEDGPCHYSAVHVNRLIDAIEATLDASPAPQTPELVNTGRWFVERQHPDKKGFTQVQGPMSEPDSRRRLIEWIRQREDLNPRRWEHVVSDPSRQMEPNT